MVSLRAAFRKWVRPFIIFLAVYLLVLIWTLPTLRYKFLVTSFGDYSMRFLPQLSLGRVPYRDFYFEYPPLFVLSFFWTNFLSGLFHLPDLLSINFFLSLPVFFTVYLWLVPPGRFVSAWFLLLFLFIPANSSFDYMTSVLVVLALLTAAHGRLTFSLLLLGLTIGHKIYPLVLLPFLILLASNRWKRITLFRLSLLLIAVPYVFFSAIGGLSGILDFLIYHLDRGITWEAVPALLYLVYRLAVQTHLPLELVYGRFDRIVSVGSGVIFFVLYWRLLRLTLSLSRADRLRRELFNLSALAILALIVFSKILSPQYLLWYVLLLPFTDLKIYKMLYLPSLVILILTLINFLFYPRSPHGESSIWLSTTPLLVRNLILLASLFKFWGYFFRSEVRPVSVSIPDSDVGVSSSR